MATQHAAGPFDVKIVPQGEPDKAPGSTLARMSIEKQYHGNLEATATGEMLSSGHGCEGFGGLRGDRARDWKARRKKRKFRAAAQRYAHSRYAGAEHHSSTRFGNRRIARTYGKVDSDY